VDCTYPIAVGRSSSSHEEIEKLFAADLKILANSADGKLFDHGEMKSKVRVRVRRTICFIDGSAKEPW
jgi:hypothetical protein